MPRYYFTSESVTEGHPDKMADTISDSILDAYLLEDPDSRVACETLITRGLVVIAGEITSNATVDIQSVARKAIIDIGYNRPEIGFDGNSCGIAISVNKQSPDIAMGVDTGGAGDQGMMFGFACDETDELMPMPISLAQRLALRLSQVRKEGVIPYLLPDGKTQVTVEYENGKPKSIKNVVVSSHHMPNIDMGQLKRDIAEKVVYEILPGNMYSKESLELHVNPTGKFEVGGPVADTGLTGRKIIVDTYGGMGRHGGGCFSGKDPSKVDRSGAYIARYIAKNLVAAKIAQKCEIQIAYVIGVARPLSICVDTFGTSSIDNQKIEEAIYDIFDLTPAGIINALGLKRPIYRQTAAYGHFGRNDLDLPWEKTDKAEELQSRLLCKSN